MTHLRDLVTDWTLGLETFCARNPHPALLHGDTADRMDRQFRTSMGSSAPSLAEIEAELSPAPDLFIWPLRKGAASVYSDKINVGRTRTSDVALLYPRVSKFHAYFTWEGDPPTYFLTDADSTNGTFIDGKKLPPKVPTPVRDGAFVTFGVYHFRFILPASLFHLVGDIAQPSASADARAAGRL
jgi:hypothetical protein